MAASLPSGLMLELERLMTADVPAGLVYVNDIAGPVVSVCRSLRAST